MTTPASDQLRGVLPIERQTVVAHSFFGMLDELWGKDEPSDNNAQVILVSDHGPLNFAATFAFSALLKSKCVEHDLLPADAIAPGKFPEIDIAQVKFVCLCYLVAPTEAKHNYLLRRLNPLLKEVRLLRVAWSGATDDAQTQTPSNTIPLLPLTFSGAKHLGR